MQRLHESTVLPEEIDSLGHMNVRYYMARMERANRQLMGALGIPTDLMQRSFTRRTDTYTRFRREQFEGATLHTMGGVLSLEEGGMRSYIEIRNPATDEVAATFITTTALIDQATRAVLPLPAPDNDSASEQIEIPDYAQPRTLSLGHMNTDITLEELNACIPEIEGGGMMSGKREAVIEADDVDAQGWLREDVELMFLPFAKMAAQENVQQGPPVFHSATGQRVGWAVMETRTQLFAQPRLGDEIAYFSADLDIQEKSRLSRRWALDRHTGQLLGMSDTVGVCIDLDARRAVAWPQELREQIQRYQQPQLA
jgi:acyl-CoA thioester hydrolase